MLTRYSVSPAMTALIAVAGFRAVRGAELAVSGHVHKLAGSMYLVDGSAGEVYAVDVSDGSCNCPDGHAPHVGAIKFCKHMAAVMLAQGGAE